MRESRSPIAWFGGKHRMAPFIASLLPPHRVYVEPFGGGASVLFAKRPSLVEVYNDLDSGLVNFFRVLRDPAQSAELRRRLELTPHSREEWCSSLAWREESEPVERARLWYTCCRQSFSGDVGQSWSFSVLHSCRGRAGCVSQWQGAIDHLQDAANRLLRVQIEHRDALWVINQYDTEDTVFYIDPPYVSSTRRNGEYAHEMTDTDHETLIARLLTLRGQAVLSGYDHPIYAPLDAAGWRRCEREVACHAAARTRTSGLCGKGNAAHQRRTEVLWLTPARYAGTLFDG